MKTILCVKSRLLALILGPEANQNGVSLFDVKALYDAAYEEKAKGRASIRTFRALLVKAETLDAAYRAQLIAQKHHLYGKAV